MYLIALFDACPEWCVSAIVHMTCSLDVPAADTGRVEATIVRRSQEFPSLVASFLGGAAICFCAVQVIKILTHNSLSIYMFCETRSALSQLVHTHNTGQLKTTLEEMFTQLAESTEPIHIRKLVWRLTNYLKCAQSFRGQQGEIRANTPR